MTTKKSFDAIIIGAGQAGPSLAVKCAEQGMKVALVERNLFGGTCVNTGCIPTKTWVASAQAANTIKKSDEFGIHIDGAFNIDITKVKARKDKIVAHYRHAVEKWLEKTPNCTLFRGHAKFLNQNTLQVDETELTADKIFINVGARAATPPMPGLEKIEYLTNSSLLALDHLPEHLIIIGGSYIGLEFAQMFHRFGAKVTVIEKADHLIPREDQDVSDEIKRILEAEGIQIKLQAECIAFDKQDKNIVVKTKCNDPNTEVIGTHVLLAIGRKPNTDDLGLDKAGIEIDERGYIKVNDLLQTSTKHIWALGECNGKGAFTHTAYNDYEILADNLFNNGSRRVSDRILTYGLFIDPPLGRAGMTATEARKAGKTILIGKRKMDQVKRAVIKGDANGFMKIIVDADTKQILGAAILGVDGDEVVQSILDVMYTKSPYTLLKNAMHIHPTVSELVPTTLGELKA